MKFHLDKLTIWTGKAQSCLILLLTLCLYIELPAISQQPGINDKSPSTVQSKLQIPEVELGQRLNEDSQKALQLGKSVSEQIQQLLKAADSYEVDAYRKADDQLMDTYEQQDANYLEMSMLAEALSAEKTNQGPATLLKQSADLIKTSKMFSYKSSAIFFLCFGLPVQSSHYSRLALSLAEANASQQPAVPPLLFYSGAASFWSSEYAYAEEQLKRCLELDPNQPIAAYYLGETYIAENQTAKAIEYLKGARQRATDNELKGNLDRALAFAYFVDKQAKPARECAELSGKELSSDYRKEFPSIAKESLGVVSAISGDYANAESLLTEALQGLQQSPLKLGNKLEAAQTALWRSYCRYKMGQKTGANEDRQFAIGLSDEASHLWHLASVLDRTFGFKETAHTVDKIPDKWAIVVGVGSFADPAIPRLRYPCKDAQDMKDFLITAAGFKPDHIKLLLDSDATRTAIVDNLASTWLPTVTKPGDLIVLFISSHGTPAYKEIGALNSVVTYDTQIQHLFNSSIPMQSIVRMLHSKLKKQHTFVILDTCYAGGLGAPGATAQNAANVDPELCVVSKRQLLVSSSDSGERSWESKRYQNSIFTRQFVNILEKNLQFDDFHNVFPQIAEKVNQEVSTDFQHTQTPKLAGSWSGKGFTSTNMKTASLERGK